MFEEQLLREDVARLEKLKGIIATASNIDEFKKAGMVIGWTKGDLRTFELKEELDSFLTAFYNFHNEKGTEQDVLQSWNKLNQKRRKVLLHCL